MKSFLKTISCAAILLLCAGHLSAQHLHLQTLDSFVAHIEQHNRGIGNLTVSKAGKEIYHRNFGQSQLPAISSKEDMRYHIGSVTKTYTAVMIFQLIEKGQLSLDTRLATYYPDMPGASDITIRQMLEHTSGLGDYCVKGDDANWLLQPVTTASILQEIRSQGLLFTPGTQESYSNSAYFLLAGILEKQYKTDYGTILKQQIIRPLSLRHTQSSLTKPAPAAPSFQYEQEQWTAAADFEFTNTKGAGDITASPRDMLQFINALFTYKLLQPASVAIMKPDPARKEYFGRGLMLIPMRTVILYGHGGDTKGTHCVLAYNETDSVSIALTLNGERYSRNSFIAGILSIMYEEPFTFPVFKDIALTAKDLDRYSGLYSAPGFPLQIQISHTEGLLTAQGTGQPAFPLEVIDHHIFQFEQAGVQMEFLPDKDIMILHQGGQSYEMRRQR